MEDKNEEIYEYLLTEKRNEEQIVLEALGCNFIGLKNNNTLVFPDDKILSGIARAILINAVTKDYNIIYESPSIKEVLNMKELYLCSVSRGIFPIIKINNKLVNNGKPGKHFDKIKTLYDKQLQTELHKL